MVLNNIYLLIQVKTNLGLFTTLNRRDNRVLKKNKNFIFNQIYLSKMII